MSSYLRHVFACNPPVDEPFLPWTIDRATVGWIRPVLAERLSAFGDVFTVTEYAVELVPALDDFEVRSRALARVVDELAVEGYVHPVMGEPYAVTAGGREQALCVIDRVAASTFGVRSFGQHLNGFVRRDGEVLMWIGRRAADRRLFPGALDNMVAGGLPYGISLHENLRKECHEEAGVPAELAAEAVAVGAVSYKRVTDRGLRPDLLYCYDLELPEDFRPSNTDGEVASFALLPLDEVARIVRETDDFKLNCNLVVIDFLIRHGWLAPTRPDYLQLVHGLRQSPIDADT